MANDKVVEGARLSGQGHENGTLVQFEQDVFPHVTGEVKRLDQEELDRVKKIAESRKLKGSVFHKYELTSDDKAVLKRDQEAAEAAVVAGNTAPPAPAS